MRIAKSLRCTKPASATKRTDTGVHTANSHRQRLSSAMTYRYPHRRDHSGPQLLPPCVAARCPMFARSRVYRRPAGPPPSQFLSQLRYSRGPMLTRTWGQHHLPFGRAPGVTSASHVHARSTRRHLFTLHGQLGRNKRPTWRFWFCAHNGSRWVGYHFFGWGCPGKTFAQSSREPCIVYTHTRGVKSPVRNKSHFG